MAPPLVAPLARPAVRRARHLEEVVAALHRRRADARAVQRHAMAQLGWHGDLCVDGAVKGVDAAASVRDEVGLEAPLAVGPDRDHRAVPLVPQPTGLLALLVRDRARLAQVRAAGAVAADVEAPGTDGSEQVPARVGDGQRGILLVQELPQIQLLLRVQPRSKHLGQLKLPRGASIPRALHVAVGKVTAGKRGRGNEQQQQAARRPHRKLGLSLCSAFALPSSKLTCMPH
mmetsp:Transcript_24055/g.55827  ORF Transcript_24055/g.55827 Transcript_24055/m.55827 type:complete len:230 (-) Transcript_24055:3-692(-)